MILEFLAEMTEKSRTMTFQPYGENRRRISAALKKLQWGHGAKSAIINAALVYGLPNLLSDYDKNPKPVLEMLAQLRAKDERERKAQKAAE